jgi:O-antigen/teichoic acid export membrane protein
MPGVFYQSILWKSLFFLSSFLLNILIARHYQASVSGQIFFLINSYALIILIASLSLESAMGYYISKNEISIARLINFCVAWTVLIAIGIFLFFVLKKDIIHTNNILAITFICGNLLFNYCSGISYARKNFALPNLISISITVSLMILLLIMKFFPARVIDDDVFIKIFFSSFLLQGLVTLMALCFTYVSSWRFTLPEITEFKKLFRFALVAFFANIISFLLYRVDYWFVKEYCNAAELGNYIQVSKLAQLFFILPAMLASVVFPLTAGGQQQYVNDILATISRVVFMIYLCGCAILSITGYWLFPLLFGDSFNNMYVPFLLLIPGILALSTLYTLTAYYAGINKMSVNIKGALLAFVFILVADVFFIPEYGINAAALISSIGYIIYHIYVLGTFIKQYGTPALSFFTFRLSDYKKMSNSILAGKI